MIVPADLARKHGFISPYIAVVAIQVRDTVRAFCERENYAYAGRTKDLESLAEKVESGRFSGWSTLDDFFACPIILPTLSDEEKTLTFLRSQFSEVATKRRGATQKDPLVFRFDATRFVGRLRTTPGVERNSLVEGISFEVQIRSAFEHAWSVTTHALAYKGDRIDWRRLRLAAQLKASVEQLDALVAGYQQVAETIPAQRWPEIAAKERIDNLLRQGIERGAIPSELSPRSWTRLCDNVYAVILATSNSFVRDPVRLVDAALEAIGAEIEISKDVFPRSLSLLQFCLGALAKNGFATKPLYRYVPLVTQELRDLFPASTRLGTAFDCELAVGTGDAT